MGTAVPPPCRHCTRQARYMCSLCYTLRGTAVSSFEVLNCLPTITKRSCGGDGIEPQTLRNPLTKRCLLGELCQREKRFI